MAIITISRGTFSGGQALAERLAEHLGYQCLGREEVLQAATLAYGIPMEKLTEAMDKPPSFWERLMGERAHIVNYFKAALLERARGDNLVYHGYVGSLLLAGISHVIRVRVIADMETRTLNAMQRHNLTRKDAISRIKKIDKERSEWTRFLHGVDWQDPALYDVVLNLTRVGTEGACDVLADLTRLEAFKPTARSLKAMEDLTLSSRVWAALATDTLTMGSDLKVEADAGVITITGTTGAWEIVDAIPGVVSRVEGVQQVRCDVGVVPVCDTPI